MTKVTELSLYEKMSFLAILQLSAHWVFYSAMNIMTCTNYTAKMKGIHSALFEWQLKNRHQPNFGPKNIYRSDSSVTSVTDRSDRSDSSVIRRLQKWQDRRPPAAWLGCLKIEHEQGQSANAQKSRSKRQWRIEVKTRSCSKGALAIHKCPTHAGAWVWGMGDVNNCR